MLTNKQLKEIRTFMEKSENPLIFYDDDPDGLISYTLFMKKYGKGRGVVGRVRPSNHAVYLRKIQEHSPDLIVFLDIPVLDQELIDHINVPIVWIDHHQPLERKGVHYYNPMVNSKGKDNRPTSYWSYQVTQENLDIAMIGILADWHIPKDLLKNFKHKALLENKKTPGAIMFTSSFGNFIKLVVFILKGPLGDVKKRINTFIKLENLQELIDKTTPRSKFLYKTYEKHNKMYDRIRDKALAAKTKKQVYTFTYQSKQINFTSTLSNDLLFSLPNEVFILGRIVDEDMRLSLRSRNIDIQVILKKALEQFEGHGGGHANACGASIKYADFEDFVTFFRKEVKKKLS